MPRHTRFRRLFGLDPPGDVDDELSFHLEMRARELVARGESPERARELARRRFGDLDGSRRACVTIDERRRRRMKRAAFVTELRQDISYALRLLRRAPGFTAVVVLTLALGIGANAAIFSVVHAVLLQPLPYADADRLYRVRMLYPDGTFYTGISAPDFMSVREESGVFDAVEAYVPTLVTLLGGREPREARAVRVSDGLFTMLGLQLAEGRAFSPDEHQPGRGSVAVLDHGFWTREFGADRSMLGRTFTIGGRPVVIVGVLAPDARVTTSGADLYLPIEYDETFDAATAQGRRNEFLGVIARARPGLDAAQVDAGIRTLGARLQTAFPNTNDRLMLTAIPMRDLIVGDVRTPLLVLLGAVGFVLLVACANVANLLLARASGRQTELAVRAALGAGRLRLMRQLLTESVVLGLLGAAAGLALAYWATRALVAAQPADIPRLDSISVDATVVLFTLAVALITSLLFGVVPAIQTAGEGLERTLRAGGRGVGGSRGAEKARATLLVAETALAVVLLAGAGLLLRSFYEMTQVSPGFRPEQAVALRLTLQGEAYREPPQIRQRVEEIEARVRAMPGVAATGATTLLPLSGLSAILSFAVVGAPPPPPNVNPEIAVASVTPGYFEALGTPLVRGRGFSERDHAEAPPVAIINEAAVRRWFPGVDPIGQRVDIGIVREVVGVVGDVLHESPGEPPVPQLYAPYAQRTTRTVRLVVRSAGDPLTLTGAIRREIRALDPNLAVPEVLPLEDLVTESMARPRFYTSLLLLFAGAALVLAAVGIFGVMSYTVAQRVPEISIRMALGAQAGDVVRSVVGRALTLAATGAAIGLVAALALGRTIQSQLFGVSLFDPITLAGVLLVLMTSAVLASVLPALRAARLDPARALREG